MQRLHFKRFDIIKEQIRAHNEARHIKSAILKQDLEI